MTRRRWGRPRPITETRVKTIAELHRLRNTLYGNPRYRIVFTDGSEACTRVDAECAYWIEGAEYQGAPIEVTFDRNGQIVYVQDRWATARRQTRQEAHHG